MAKINPYLMFNGNAEEAFNFYKSVFGGEFSSVVRFSDLPGNPNQNLNEKDAHKIMHIALPIGENYLLMASDGLDINGKLNEYENRSKICINTESKDEADQLFNGLSANGQVEVPISDSPWSSYFGMFRDKFGIEWMIDCTLQPQH
ncbi:VOC family protein [Fulvivirga maritima]|uniref:VOC family protein n=1 Tax=Fulvivirga maritima TaxID=2904247 RepID=UPI001F3E9008|nr:VOC family protein [Fulvivirga maritima]UII26422.1 VOC family protein [Fulvivirga maritima]